MSRARCGVRQVRGVSLVELMVAMVLGLVLMLGVIQIFSASQAASRLAEGASRVQENARFALDFLERDLRMAGHMGCVNDQAHVVKDLGDPVSHLGAAVASGSPLDFRVSIQGYEAPGTAPGEALTLGGTWGAPAGLPDSLGSLSPAPAGGSDILVMRYLAAEGVPVDTISVDGGDSTIRMDAGRIARISAGGVGRPTLFGIADCSHADVFAGDLSGDTVSAADVDLGRYTVQPTGQTMVYRAESLVYYVGRNADTGLRGLRRARADSTGAYTVNEELVEGIENLQLLYGLDATAAITPGTPPTGNITQLATASVVSPAADRTPAAAARWLRVGQVRVGLLAASESAASPVQPEAAMAALGLTFRNAARNDGRYRATYESTIALRNRLFGN